jgi:hypothetical protein
MHARGSYWTLNPRVVRKALLTYTLTNAAPVAPGTGATFEK